MKNTKKNKNEITSAVSNKNNRVLTIRLPSNASIFLITFFFIVVYVLTFFLINSFASGNNLEKRNILQPQKWFKQIDTIPTIVVIPTNFPTPTPSPIPVKKAVNTDPVVICEHQSPECAGKSIEVRKSQCSNTSCCQIGNSWEIYATVEKCKEAQTKNKPQQTQTTNTNNNQNRVQYTVTNGLQNGTYYCYPNRVNELTQQDQAIKSWQAALDHCKFQQQPTQDSCIAACNGNSNYSACIQPCYDSYLSVCKSEIDSLYNSRKELSNKVHEICP